jgi:hypothetical protein
MAEQENEPGVGMQATFYFPPGTSYEDAMSQISARLDGMDYTSVMAEIPAEMRPELMAES